MHTHTWIHFDNLKKKIEKKILQANDMVVGVAGNMEPNAGDESMYDLISAH